MRKPDAIPHGAGGIMEASPTEAARLLGCAAAGSCVVVGSDGSRESRACAMACAAAALEAGCDVVSHDAPMACAAGWVSHACRAGLGVFFQTQEDAPPRAVFHDGHGLPLPPRPVPAHRPRADGFGQAQTLAGAGFLYESAALGEGLPALPRQTRVWVAGEHEAAAALRRVLYRAGARLEPGAFVRWEPSPDGMSLAAVDENGDFRDDLQTLGAALLEGCALRRTLYLPRAVPARLQALLSARGAALEQAQTLRERREAARERFLWDGVMRAAFLTRRMAEKGRTLAKLCENIPQFCVYSRELYDFRPRTDLYGRLRAAFAAEAGAEVFSAPDGLRLDSPRGHARLSPGLDARSLRITAEAASMEAAAALCDAVEGAVNSGQ